MERIDVGTSLSVDRSRFATPQSMSPYALLLLCSVYARMQRGWIWICRGHCCRERMTIGID